MVGVTETTICKLIGLESSWNHLASHFLTVETSSLLIRFLSPTKSAVESILGPDHCSSFLECKKIEIWAQRWNIQWLYTGRKWFVCIEIQKLFLLPLPPFRDSYLCTIGHIEYLCGFQVCFWYLPPPKAPARWSTIGTVMSFFLFQILFLQARYAFHRSYM